jgi:hypothetical protein
MLHNIRHCQGVVVSDCPSFLLFLRWPSTEAYNAAITVWFSRPKHLKTPHLKKNSGKFPNEKITKEMFSIELIKTCFRNAEFKRCFSLLCKYNDK